MRIEKSLQLRDEAAHQLRELFARSREFSHPHSQMLNERAKILSPLAKAPHWVHSYLGGIWDSLQFAAYQNDLIYGAFVDGVFYSTYSSRADYYGKHGIEPSAFAEPNPTKGHYWAHSLKPFFVS